MNRFMLICSLLLASMSCLSNKQAAVNNQSVARAEQELQQLERSLIAAIQRKDTETLNRIWADEYLGTTPDGRMVTKADLISAVKGGAIALESLEVDDLRVRLFGDVAVMTGHARVKANVDNEDYSGSYRGTGIFIKRDGGWEVVGVQVGPAKRCKP
jgi:ketosteroid isomerase-like protein